MSDSLGARLRRRREEQGIALTAIADDTKIKVSLLEALERDDVTQWPSGIFRRAYVRTYAQAIGLNPDAIVREFVETHPGPEEIAAAALAAAQAARPEPPAGSARLRQIMGSALESLTRLRRSAAANESAAVIAPPAQTSELLDECPAIEPPVVAVASSEPEVEVQRDIVPERVAAPVREPEAVAVPAPIQPPAPDYAGFAQLCTAFAQVERAEQADALLEDAAPVLDATGIIVWIVDDVARELRPALSSGYSQKVLAQIPFVSVDGDNITAAAFRTSQLCALPAGTGPTAALAVPLPSPTGCVGVLALEVQPGGEEMPWLRAAATILAAMLGGLAGQHAAEKQSDREDLVGAVAHVPSAFRVVARR